MCVCRRNVLLWRARSRIEAIVHLLLFFFFFSILFLCFFSLVISFWGFTSCARRRRRVFSFLFYFLLRLGWLLLPMNRYVIHKIHSQCSHTIDYKRDTHTQSNECFFFLLCIYLYVYVCMYISFWFRVLLLPSFRIIFLLFFSHTNRSLSFSLAHGLLSYRWYIQSTIFSFVADDSAHTLTM